MNRTSRLLATGLALGLAAVLLVSALPAVAQTDVTTGRIVGQVTDNEGQPLPGVSVEAKNTGTGLTLVQVTDARGLYRIVNVPVGSYAVSANLSGFQKSTRTGITVNLASAITVDLKLQLSSVSEALTVTAEAPVIETTQTASQAIVDNSAIQSLPVSGRNFYDFVLLTPNAQRDRERQNLALSGQRGIATNVTVDGVDFTNAFFGGTTGAGEGRAPLSISQESVREFQVVQSGASAEYGRSGGGFVNVITKSGSNEWHGAVFGYYRPSDWSATLADGTEPRDSKKYNLGASFGGPAIKEGWVLRIGVESTGTQNRIVRCSLYEGTQHRLSIAIDDRDRFVAADEPESTPELAAAFDDSPAPRTARSDLPSVYDGIY
ncbi:hypothetical protein FBQ97_20475, partial [Acidobacteria bacterium ACD]|nr:hypothetical protein [Acidobacteria bacterium ACD]